MVEDVVDRILLTEEEIQNKVEELGAQITRDYRGSELLLVGILSGAVIFMADLARAISVPVAFDFMDVSSYGNSSQTSGVVRILKDLERNIDGQHVLIVEDIVDTGLTLDYLLQGLEARNPASLRVCALLNKPERRIARVNVDYSGYNIPDEFVCGYGLDYADKYRNLPYIFILREEIYS